MSEQEGASTRGMRAITPQELRECLEEARARKVSPWDVLITEKQVSDWLHWPHRHL